MDPYRLPRSVIPSRYDLRLEPNLADATFAGQVLITGHVRESVSVVLLNAAELQIAKASFIPKGGRNLDAVVSLDAEVERAKLAFAQPLPLGEGTFSLHFTGTLNSTVGDSSQGGSLVASSSAGSVDWRRGG